MSMQPHSGSSDDLNAYIDDALASNERIRLEEQLATDRVLQGELDELRATATLLGQLPELVPSRSFTLGARFAHPAKHLLTGNGLRLLPIVRSLSVAAILVFTVITGSLFFDIHGGADDDAQVTFQRQDALLGNRVTEPQSGASDDAEDARVAAAPENESSQVAASDEESSMTSRGDAASAGDEPMDDLTALDQSADTADVAKASGSTEQGGILPDEDRTNWVWTSVAIGGLALVLAGFWLALAQVGRQSRLSPS